MENIIEITNVRKIYRTYQKKSGLKNMIKNIIYPDFKDFIAVDDMSFCIRKGDIVGYIGPNGAGKSTTIKMLTGILVPNSGMIKVFGKDPLKYRKENSKHIGVVFGQKSQLWWDKPYYKLYENIKNIFIDGGNDYESLLKSAKEINQKPGILWRNLIFKTTNIGVIRKHGASSINNQCPFLNCKSEQDLKETFFKYLHVFKAKATLSDYFDLNRRYFNITDTIIFEDSMIKLDMIPKYFFKEIMDNLYKDAFKKDDNLQINVKLETISSAFEIDINKVYESLSKDLGITLTSPEQAATYVNDERYRRFNEMIDKRFSDSVLIELLNCFENRNDKRIEELVTDEATIPTIFEYILGIIWYKVSERQGNILDFMQLSLEANLLPKTHAAGGYADIIYEYEACLAYPKHALLLEATLADGTNQRRMEMEPVSRHLGDYRIRFNNPFDYSLFVSTYLDKNVISDFRYRKIIPYTRDEETITGMKIISMDTDSLKKIIENNIKYKYLYEVFDKYYEMPLDTADWHTGMIKEATEEYKV